MVQWALILNVATGCSVLRASPHKATSFLPVHDKIDEDAEHGPFQGLVFLDQEKFFQLNGQTMVWYVAPVNTSILSSMIGEALISEEKKAERLEELQEIGRYTKVAFEHFLSSNEVKPQTISETPTKKGLILELALVEIEPTSPLINVVGAIAGFFVPGGGLISTFGSGSVAVEGIVRDSASKKVLLEFKDREKDKIAPFTLKDFQRYAHLREAIQEWATLFSEFIATNGMKEISRPLPFTLNPL